MTQDTLVILLLKISLISAFCSLVGWVVTYHRLSHGNWRHNAIGQTLVTKTLLVAGLLVPFTLSLFFHLNRQDSRICGWVDVVLLGAIAPVMLWRSVVWLRVSRAGPSADDPVALRARIAELEAIVAGSGAAGPAGASG